VDVLVGEMAAAGDIGDARKRAGGVLQAFEQFVMTRVGGDAGPSGRTAALGRENAILKRAVQIQNARLQELGAAREAEVAGLRDALGRFQERVQALEVHNYSLTLHLQAANAPGGLTPTQRPPDVY
jgi:hypothetical protein